MRHLKLFVHCSWTGMTAFYSLEDSAMKEQEDTLDCEFISTNGCSREQVHWSLCSHIARCCQIDWSCMMFPSLLFPSKLCQFINIWLANLFLLRKAMPCIFGLHADLGNSVNEWVLQASGLHQNRQTKGVHLQFCFANSEQVKMFIFVSQLLVPCPRDGEWIFALMIQLHRMQR